MAAEQFSAQAIKDTTQAVPLYASQTLWEQFIDFCFGKGPGTPGNEQSAGLLQPAKISLTPAQIKTLNSIPVLAIPSPGVGKAIEIISANAKLNFRTVAYSNISASLITDTATSIQYAGTFLDSTSTAWVQFTPFGSTENIIQFVENKGVFIKANADSASGDSPVDIYISYRIITL